LTCPNESELRTILTALTALLIGQTASSAGLPSAGSQLQQIPDVPAAAHTPPELQLRPTPAAPIVPANEITLVVNHLRVINAHAFSEKELLATAGFEPGSELTLSGLRDFAAKIADYYHRRGYFLAQAALPAQDIVDGIVTIAVVEGEYGNIVLRNQSKLSDALAHQLLDGLDSGDTITIAPLESRLLRLSDLPGVNIKSTLTPGASVGASDLIVDVTPGRRVSGSFDADNSGSRYTGAYRAGATLSFNNPFGYGDAATLRAFSSFDGLNYGRAAYQRQLLGADIGVAFTALDYELGREFESLKAHGTAQIASIFGRLPLQRSRESNVYVQLGLDTKTFRDEVDVTAPATVAEKAANVGMLSFVGDRRDRMGGGGLSTYALTWASGSLDLKNPQMLLADAMTARTDGHFDKVTFELMRLQSVTEAVSVYIALQGQLTDQNLDVSEKLGLAGANAVRAYPEGELYVDAGYLVNVEARTSLPRFVERMPGQLQWVVFFDGGTGDLNEDPWSQARNRRTLSAAGMGLNWFDAGRFTMKTYYAHKLGSEAATSAPDADGRFWLSAIRYF
jgi:hemolysin activation/secretion protein